MKNEPWNETNPEWWKLQVESRGELAWQWLVNEWMARECSVAGCWEPVAVVVTTAAGRLGRCPTHAAWYVARGQDIYPIQDIAEAIGHAIGHQRP